MIFTKAFELASKPEKVYKNLERLLKKTQSLILIIIIKPLVIGTNAKNISVALMTSLTELINTNSSSFLQTK